MEDKLQTTGAARGVNPFGGGTGMQMSAVPHGQSIMAASASAREVAEVQSAMIIAKKFPRDERRAVDKILNACARPTLAERALYQYARGSTDITGPTIRLAEAIAQSWGNLQCVVRETERLNDASTCEAFCWDLETNTRFSRTFTVPHFRDTKRGRVKLEDDRDIYEAVANQGARRLRACILEAVPGDVVEAAVDQCTRTAQETEQVTPERIKLMVEAFAEYGVTLQQIERRIQRHIDAMTPALMGQLRRIYASLKDGLGTSADWFDEITDGTDGGAASAATADVAAKIAASIASRKQQETKPNPITVKPETKAEQPATADQAQAQPHQGSTTEPASNATPVSQIPRRGPGRPRKVDQTQAQTQSTPSPASMASMGQQPPRTPAPPPPSTNAASASAAPQQHGMRATGSTLLNPAIEKSGVPRDQIERFLLAKGMLQAGQTVDQAPASIKRQLITEPESFGRQVNLWIDEQQAAADAQDPNQIPFGNSDDGSNDDPDGDALDRAADGADDEQQ